MSVIFFEKNLGSPYYKNLLEKAKLTALSDIFSFNLTTEIHDFKNDSYNLNGYVYFDFQPNIIIFLENKKTELSICIELKELDYEIILFETIESIIKLFRNNTFRHQRTIALDVLKEIKNILIQFDEKDHEVDEGIYFSCYDALDDLVLVEDYISFFYKEHNFKSPDFLE